MTSEILVFLIIININIIFILYGLLSIYYYLFMCFVLCRASEAGGFFSVNIK